MRRYTTPAILLAIREIDLTDGCDVYVTFRQGSRLLTKASDDPGVTVTYDGETDKTIIALTLSQAETAAFALSDCSIQVNWITREGVRRATKIRTIRIEPNLLEKEVSYAE